MQAADSLPSRANHLDLSVTLHVEKEHRETSDV